MLAAANVGPDVSGVHASRGRNMELRHATQKASGQRSNKGCLSVHNRRITGSCEKNNAVIFVHGKKVIFCDKTLSHSIFACVTYGTKLPVSRVTSMSMFAKRQGLKMHAWIIMQFER